MALDRVDTAQSGEEANRILGLNGEQLIAEQIANSQSLSEGLRARRDKGIAFQETGAGSVAMEALGDPSNRAFGERPTTQLTAAQALNENFRTIRNNVDQQISDENQNVLSAISQLLDLRRQEANFDIAKQELEIKKKEAGMLDGEDSSMQGEEFQVAQLTDEEAQSVLREKLGANIKIGGTSEERGQRSRDILQKLSRGEYVDPKEYLSEKDATKVQAYDNALSLMDEAIEILDSGGDVSGTGIFGFGGPAGIVSFRELRKKSGDIDQQSVLLESILAKIAGPEAFGDAGKALTEIEKQIVLGRIPTIDLDEETLRTILESAKKNTSGRKEDIIGIGQKEEKGRTVRDLSGKEFSFEALTRPFQQEDDTYGSIINEVKSERK